MRTILIVGASSGIGKELAILLRDTGNKVIGTYNSNDSTDSIIGVDWIKYDVRQIEALALSVENLDGLVYCPGAINLKPFLRTKPSDFESDYQLQVLGAIKVIQQFIPALKKGKHASVVLFSTVAVASGFPFHSIVSASKGAIEGLSKALAAELSPTIRVNCIAPSLTNTPLAKSLLSTEEKIQANAARHPMKAVGEAEDIAQMAAFLLGEQSKWVSGQIFGIDGGISTLRV